MRRAFRRALTTLLLPGLLAGCAGAGSNGGRGGESQAVSSKTIEQVLAAHNDSLLALPGVVGTAIGLCDGAPCIRVFLADSSASTRSRIPANLDGYLVRSQFTGPIQPRR